MDWITILLVLALIGSIGAGLRLAHQNIRLSGESARAKSEASRYVDHAVLHQQRAAEWKMVADEERALARELFAAVRRGPAPADGRWTFGDTNPDASDGDPMTVAEADRLVVEAERRRSEREAAADEEAPDLTGREPVAIRDDEAMPVHRLTESVSDGASDDDE